MSRRAIRALVQGAGSVALLVLALHLTGVDALVARLRAVDPSWLALALALTVPMQVLSAWRWRIAAGALGAPLGMHRAIGEYYVAAFLNAVVPGGVVGDAARVWRHGHRQGGARYARPLGAVLVERGAGQAALALVLGVGLAHAALVGAPATALAAPAAGLLAAGVAVLAVGAALAVALIGAATSGASGARAVLAGGLRALAAAPAACAALGLLSLAVVGIYVAAFLAAARAVGPIGPAGGVVVQVAVIGVPLVLVAMLAPVSVGGLGPREAAAAALWPAFGLDPAAGAAAALLYGAVVTVGSLPGAVLLARRSPSPAAPP